MNELERLKKIEETANSYIERVKKSSISIVSQELKELENALKPEIDWDSVQMGAVVKNKGTRVSKGKFVCRIDRDIIRVMNTNNTYDWDISDCTVEPQLRTELIKHPWPKDGKQPINLNDDDFIFTPNTDGYFLACKEIDWQLFDDWFAVLDAES